MEKSAEILVQVYPGVCEREEVLVGTDDERLPIALAVKKAAENAGGHASVMISPPRRIDSEKPAPPVAAAMRAADVIFLPITHSLAHTRATREAIGAGARVLSMTVSQKDGWAEAASW